MSIFSFFNKEKKETLDQGLSKTKENVFSKLTRAVAGKSKVDDEVLDNLEEVLVTSDVGVETTLRIIERIEARVARDKFVNTAELNVILKEEIAALLAESHKDAPVDFDAPLPSKPYVIMVVGVNGVGKTTTIGKLAHQFTKAGKKVYLGAADTFRAAAVDQLVIWGERVGVPVIKQKMGSDPASEVYVRNKCRACEEVGILSRAYNLPKTSTEAALLALITQLNADPFIDGILIQLPLPPHIQTDAVLEQIDPKKDVDGFHPYNLGRLLQRRPHLRPCTPFGVMTLLANNQLSVEGLHAVVVGASNIVGRPMALELLLAKATVTLCHRFTKKLSEHLRTADIVIAAIGNPGIIQSKWIKPGAIVIDVGINRLPDGSLIGDIEFASAKERASWITPVPGGIGPMTVAMLLSNTCQAAGYLSF